MTWYVYEHVGYIVILSIVLYLRNALVMVSLLLATS